MKGIIISIFVLVYFGADAQKIISGYITNKITGESLPGANIYEKNSKTGTVSNSYGFYSLTIEDSLFCNLQVTYVGYKNAVFQFYLKNDTLINCQLIPDTIIKEVIVSSERPIAERAEVGVIEIPMQQVKTLPMLAGETDVIKAMQLMPGIKPSSEGQSGMLVRGGSHDQNLILLDDVPIYDINHLGGFVSVFNPDAINKVKFFKGGFPARYGGRLSSIMDVRMKDGNLKQQNTNLTFGIISSRLQTEGPIKNDTASYMISGRRFMYDLFTRPLTWLINEKKSMGYTFYDLNTKFNYKFSHKNRVYLSFYLGNDKIINKKTEKEAGDSKMMENKNIWGNSLVAIRWNHVFNNQFFSNVTINNTRYRYLSDFIFSDKADNENIETHYHFKSNINDFSLKNDFEYFLSGYTLRFGSNHTYHRFTPKASFIKQQGFSNIDSTYNDKQYYAFENSIYLENEYVFSDYLQINIGGRTNLYIVGDKQYINLEPRSLINFNMNGWFGVKASYSRTTQYSHQLTYSDAGIPGDLWIPSTENVPPQKADLYTIGIAKSFLDQHVEISIESYYKNMFDIIEYKDGVSFSSNKTQNWESLIETSGKGKSKGIELLAQKKEGCINGWISYTLSRSTRQFDNINRGREYLFTYDATHDFAATANYKINKKLSISASWVYITGRAITMPNEEYHTIRLSPIQRDEHGIPVYEPYRIRSYNVKNNIRMHPYHRLDLGLTYKKQKKNSDRTWQFSIYNVYNRQNPYYYYITSDEISDKNNNPTGTYKIKTYQRSLFPIIPSISYSIKF